MPEERKRLRADKLIETTERLASRILGRFPGSGLGAVAVAIADVARQSAAVAEKINRPNWKLRVGLASLAVVVLAVSGTTLGFMLAESKKEDVFRFGQVLSGAGLWLSAAVVFFWTLETRLRRGKVVKALHELRGLAHLIDMHQLSKDPDCGPGCDPDYATKDALGTYLGFCSEMLAMLAKIGQLYVEDFPDGTTLAAVDQLENLTSTLSQKIWQKVIVLQRIAVVKPEAS